MLISETPTTDQIDVAAAEVITLILNYHDIATKIWPMQATRQDTPTPVQLKPPISRAGLRQIGRLAKLRNECNTTTKLHPEIVDDSDLNQQHINIEINQIFQPNTPLITREGQKQCSEAIGDIIRKASHTLSDKIKDKENNTYDKSPKHYHDNLKINAGITPRARDRSRVKSLINPNTKHYKRIHMNLYQQSPHTTRWNKKGQHETTYRTLHGHNLITRTISP